MKKLVAIAKPCSSRYPNGSAQAEHAPRVAQRLEEKADRQDLIEETPSNGWVP